MSAQRRFPGMNDVANYPIPTKTRTGPVLWIRRLVVLRNFSPDEDQVIRDITLRPGLNILWAKSNMTPEEDQLFSDGLSGHAAGKTTFVRLVRYILGDPTFGNADQMQAIRRVFPNAWVLGDVVINQQNWIVCRPLRITTIDSFAFSNVSLDSIFTLDNSSRVEFSTYQDAVKDATLSQLEVRTLPISRKEIDWDHVLAWLSRDQECRLGHLLSWRAPRSDSPSLQIDVADRTALVRSLLGFLDIGEQKVSTRHEKLKQEQKAARKNLPSLRYFVKQERENLEKILGQQLPALGSMFLPSVNQLITSLKAKKLESKKNAKYPSADAIAQLEGQWKAAIEKAASAEQQHKDTERQLTDASKELELADGKVTPERRSQILADLPLGRRFCNVPLREAQEHKCPLAAAHISDLAERRAANQEEADILALRKRISTLTDKLKSKHREVTQLKGQADALYAQLTKARTTLLDHAASVAKIQSEAEHQFTLAQRAFSAWESANQCEKRIKELSAEIETSREQLAGLRKIQTTNLKRFKEFFSHIVQALLGREVSTRMVLSGKGIELGIERHGDCSSVAIDTIKVIAFDLAALCASIEGVGSFPGMLIHDGPREADMAAGLYKRIFNYVRQLETACEKQNNMNFQYIITTTEPPPDDLQCSPWLINPILDAAKAESRLLGVNL